MSIKEKLGKIREGFDQTGVGIVFNTISGLPRAAVDVGKDILKETARNIGSTGITLAKPFGGAEEMSAEDFKSPYTAALFETVFGKEKLRSVEDRIATMEHKIKNNSTAKEFGLDKVALPLAFGGILGTTVLDLTPLGGSKKGLQKLVNEETVEGSLKLLRSMGAPDEVARKFAPQIAKTKTLEEVKNVFQTMQGVTGVKFANDAQKLFQPIQDSIKDPINKLISNIRGAEKVRDEIETAYTVERARRIARVEQEFGKESGEKGYFNALGKLKGKLVDDEKKIYDMIKLDQPDVDSLFNQIQKNKILDTFDKIGASGGLQKLLHGEIPQKNELKLLEEVFGSELIRTIRSKRSAFAKGKDIITEIVNLPRALMSSLDLSAVLRQAVIPTVTHPFRARKAMSEMFRQVFSQKNFEGWLSALKQTPEYKRMKDAGLYIAEPNKLAGGLAEREEAFMSAFAEKIPWVKASERAYVSYLNKTRVDMFNQIAAKFDKEGIATKANLSSLAEFVNSATGRGNLKRLENEAQTLNNVFFSPRLMKARLDFLNPVWYAKQTPAVRKEAIKSFAQFVGIGTTILGAVSMLGGDKISVETDPRSSDFGKIRIGDIRMDIWGGFQQFVTLFSQLISGERKSTNSGEVYELDPAQFPYTGRLGRTIDFGRSKLSPFVSTIIDMLEGENVVGEETTIKREIAESVTPLYLQDIVGIIRELGPESILTVGVPGLFGVGVQKYDHGKDIGNPFLPKSMKGKNKKDTEIEGNPFNSF